IWVPFAATLTRKFESNAICGVKRLETTTVIPEIDICRAANLMLKRYGDKALEESATRADELFAQDDYNGAAVWRRITDAVGQLANQTPAGPLHCPASSRRAAGRRSGGSVS